MRDLLLKEKLIHGTSSCPVNALHFNVEELDPHEMIVENHWHSYVEILLIRRGRYQVQVNFTGMELVEGDICILNSGDLHQIRSLERSCVHDAFLFSPEILTFEYPDQWNQDVLKPLLDQRILLGNLIQKDNAGYERIRRAVDLLFEITLDHQKQSYWYARCKLRLFELLLELMDGGYLRKPEQMQSPVEQTSVERYKKIVNYIAENYREELDLDNLAALIPCNSQYLCRYFKKISGETPIQYLIRYRIECAARLLEETDHKISDIAMDCGFDNISYFIRKFKELKGRTPGEYRKMY